MAISKLIEIRTWNIPPPPLSLSFPFFLYFFPFLLPSLFAFLLKISLLISFPFSTLSSSSYLFLHPLPPCFVSFICLGFIPFPNRHFNRGGFKNRDDPGLQFKLEEPAIIKALNTQAVSDLPLGMLSSNELCYLFLSLFMSCDFANSLYTDFIFILMLCLCMQYLCIYVVFIASENGRPERVIGKIHQGMVDQKK